MTLNDLDESLAKLRSRRSAGKIKRSRQYKERDARLKLQMEQLEERALMTLGPTLIAINPNTGAVLADGDTRNIAPTELTFRFDQGQVLDRTTLAAGISIVRSGG